MPDTEHTLRPEYLAVLDELVRWFQSGRLDPEGPRSGDRRQPRGRTHFAEGHLTEDLAAATDPRTGPATAAFLRYEADPLNPGELVEGKDAVVTNRSVDHSALSGTYMIVVRMNGEWRPLWSDCEPFDSGE